MISNSPEAATGFRNTFEASNCVVIFVSGMFTGGLGFQYGAERLGALTVPAAAGNTKRQIKFITDFGTTCLHIIPSYATRLAEVMYEMGIDPRKDTKLHTVCIGAEPHSEEQRKRIEQLLGVKAYNCFGMSEMNGPGVAFECQEQNGLHIWEDNVIVEIIDLSMPTFERMAATFQQLKKARDKDRARMAEALGREFPTTLAR